MRPLLTAFVFVLVVTTIHTSFAQVKLPQIVRDSMILQRDIPVNIWGWSAVNEKVSVKFNGKTYKTKGNAEGKWSIKLPATKAGGPYTIDIIASNKISIKEILFFTVATLPLFIFLMFFSSSIFSSILSTSFSASHPSYFLFLSSYIW